MTTRSLGSTLAAEISPPSVQISQQSGHFKMLNTSGRRIVFGVSTALKKATTTPTGVLDPNEAALFVVKCEGKEEQNDRVTIIYTHPPEGSEKRYKSEYFQADHVMITRKNIPSRFSKITAVLAKIESN